MVPLYTEESLFKGIRIEKFHCIQISGDWNRDRKIPNSTEVFSFQVVGIKGLHYIYRGVLT